MVRTPAWVTDRPVAHRGLHDEQRPENSLAAFEAAVDAGLPLELDVHPSLDAEAVVFHDESLLRMTATQGDVREWPWHRLRELHLGGTSERVPSLAQVLRMVDGRVPVVVEVKNSGAVGVIERATARVLDVYTGPVAVQSFNPLSMAWFRRECPEIPRGLLAGDMAESDFGLAKRVLLQRMLLAPHVRPAYVGYDLQALPEPSASLLRRLGVPLLAWTVRTREEQTRALQLADNYIFEFVEPIAVRR
ncbi:MAG: glycerophosphodiester phosphodiesterase family protein [Nannocystales bacterium]